MNIMPLTHTLQKSAKKKTHTPRSAKVIVVIVLWFRIYVNFIYVDSEILKIALQIP